MRRPPVHAAVPVHRAEEAEALSSLREGAMMTVTLRRAGALTLAAVVTLIALVPAYTHLRGEYQDYVVLCGVYGGFVGIVTAIDAGARAMSERFAPPGADPGPPPLELGQIDIQDPPDWLREVYLPEKLLEGRFMLGLIDRQERDSLRAANVPWCGMVES